MYKFKFEIIDTETDEVITSDWTSFDIESVDQFGAVETVDIHTGSALRYVKRFHAKHDLQNS